MTEIVNKIEYLHSKNTFFEHLFRWTFEFDPNDGAHIRSLTLDMDSIKGELSFAKRKSTQPLGGNVDLLLWAPRGKLQTFRMAFDIRSADSSYHNWNIIVNPVYLGSEKIVVRSAGVTFKATADGIGPQLVAIDCRIHVERDRLPELWRKETPSSMGKDFGKALTNTFLSDVTLVCQGEEFPCHKIILASRSPVFAATFNSDLLKLEDNKVFISNVDVEIFKKTLNFIYKDELPQLVVQDAQALLTFAAIYELKTLVEHCETSVADNLEVETVVDVLLSAHDHSRSYLKAKAIAFIAKNLSAVQSMETWKNVASVASLLDDILKEVANLNLPQGGGFMSALNPGGPMNYPRPMNPWQPVSQMSRMMGPRTGPMMDMGPMGPRMEPQVDPMMYRGPIGPRMGPGGSGMMVQGNARMSPMHAPGDSTFGQGSGMYPAGPTPIMTSGPESTKPKCARGGPLSGQSNVALNPIEPKREKTPSPMNSICADSLNDWEELIESSSQTSVEDRSNSNTKQD